MRSKKRKIAIVWANPYNKNLGVAALAYSSMALIRDVLDENNIEGEITFIGSYKRGKDAVNINGKTIGFDNIIGLDYFNWKSFAKILLRPGQYDIMKLFSFDYIFDVAEGDSFTDLYGDRRYYRIIHSKKLFNLLRKKQILLPQTIGPFKNADKQNEAIGIMKRLEMVLSRDKKSYDYTAGFLPKEKICELMDMAFYMPFQRRKLENGKVNVGINISGLLWNGGYTGDNQFNMKTDYREIITKVLDHFSGMDEILVHIISHVIPVNSPVEDDSKVAVEIQERYPAVILSPKFESPIEAKSYISAMDFFTGARMHACIAAFSSGVPVVPMAYSRKFNGLFCDTLQYTWLGDCVNSDTEVVFNTIKEGFINRAALKNNIEQSEKEIIKPRLQKLKDILYQTLA
ncbi:MAG: polysaccharide pyruvyl transferase family protein [Niabella sp.]